MKRKASLHNLGCKVNAYETEGMQQLLEEAGYEIVAFGEPADVCVINTCSVTNVADKKSRQMIHRARAKNPEAVIVAAGCYVQAKARELEQDEAVDIIIGNNRKKELPAILEAYFQNRRDYQECREGWENRGNQENRMLHQNRIPHQNQGLLEGQEIQKNRESQELQEICGRGNTYILDIGNVTEYEELRIRKISDHTRAFMKIQDGCNQFCSYCIIPYTRGRVRSRKPEDVLEEVKTLAAAGYREIVLTGIHLSSYGTEFTESTPAPLLDLIRSIHKIPGISRIRLGSLEPRIVNREFARALASLPKICPHFHLSLQSGCEATLKRMNRHYTPEQYLEGCRILREEFDTPAITTDVIVGFPGETEEEFEETRRFLEQAAFYEMHIFKYSRRANTRAAAMPDQIPEDIKGKRSDILLDMEKRMSLEYRKSFLEKASRVLLEEEAEIGGEIYLTGYTPEYVKMAVRPEMLPGLERGRNGGSRNWKGEILEGVGSRMLSDEIVELAF